jgi:glutathione peroxidase-family protein
MSTAFIQLIKLGCFLFLFPLAGISQQGLYTIQFQNINNQPVSLSQFTGKKIVVSVINAAAPDELHLKQLDTLQKNNMTNVKIIAVPITNFGTPVSNDSLRAIRNRLNLSYILSKPGKGKKSDLAQQHRLLQWLTHLSANARFDKDVDEAGQMFVVSEGGVLFAVMKNKVRPTGTAMNRLITHQSPD